MRIAIAVAAMSVITACVAPSPRPEPVTVDSWDRTEPGPRIGTPVDLMRSLGLHDRPGEELGAVEKTFNSCALDPHPEPCATRFITMIHFQLLCRDTEGTVTDSPVAPEPITTEDLRWSVGELSGATRTDERGYGEIIALSDRSLLEQRLTLRMGAKFLGLTVGEITKVVLPNNFCQKH